MKYNYDKHFNLKREPNPYLIAAANVIGLPIILAGLYMGVLALYVLIN